jgi:hypothetical protein
MVFHRGQLYPRDFEKNCRKPSKIQAGKDCFYIRLLPEPDIINSDYKELRENGFFNY